MSELLFPNQILLIQSRLNNSDKGAVTHAIFHHVLWEYLAQLNEISDEAEQEKLRRDIFEG